MTASKWSIVRRVEAAVPRSMPADDLLRVAAVGAVSAIIDVRPPEAYAAGHISGAVNIPETKITALVHAVTRHPNAVLVCDDGRLSTAVARTLAFCDFTGIYCLDGGLAAWNEVGGFLVTLSARGTERRVGRPERPSKLSRLARLLSFRLLFLGLAASAGTVALALRLFS
ncbi:MAG TPA: rhodanese-like domain-containing protein [Planctomycetota bacterium]